MNMRSLCVILVQGRANLCRIVPVPVLRCIAHWLYLGDRPTPCFRQTRCALHFSSCRRVRVLLAGLLLRGACPSRSWSALPVADRPTPLPATSSRSTFLVSCRESEAGNQKGITSCYVVRDVPRLGALTVGISASCCSPPASILPPLQADATRRRALARNVSS